ncbi:protein FdhE homolog [Striga asiatica]|uniref:Protein FdhE homolog n=1 Tax=Striga asiatica TaxID=4170 RepID=A0A5A7PB42_STRAF|nr:protein FdhE homolog [Striga asiatica]
MIPFHSNTPRAQKLTTLTSFCKISTIFVNLTHKGLKSHQLPFTYLTSLLKESNSSTQPPLEVQAVPREGDMAMQIEKGYAPPALTIKPVQGKTWKRAASKVCRLARESETTQVIPSPKHNKRTKEES